MCVCVCVCVWFDLDISCREICFISRNISCKSCRFKIIVVGLYKL